MTSREYIAVTLTIILAIVTVNTNARSWDLAVVIGREVEFFARNRTLTGQAQLAEAAALAGVAYDDKTRTMFFSDTSNKNVSIFSNDLTDKNFTLKPLLKRQNKSHILGIAFDTRTRTLFWSDALKGVIMKMKVPIDGPPEEPVLLHDLPNLSPRAIALDVCNSHIYWVNSNNSNPSVERSNLDGTDRIAVIKENLYEPVAVAVDHVGEKLYWIDDVEGLRIKIERSNLDGSERELVVHPKRQQPIYLVVDNDSIYWSDMVYRAIWTISKDAKPGDTPTQFHSYSANHDADPTGIVARDNVGKIDCEAIARIRHKKTSATNSTFAQPIVESYNNLITSTEESESTTEHSRHCLNDGSIDEKTGDCHCKSGFAGVRCETNLCHNYCLHGDCVINNDGLPWCKCSGTFIGLRCETDLCKDYCLHNGRCSVQNNEPICKCKYSEGSRCEILYNSTEICEMYCTNSESVPISISVKLNCRCSEVNQRMVQMAESRNNDEYRILLSLFGAFIALLALVIIVLSYYINKLRRRPRIKKRFVVSKGGVTPLTSRPQLPDSQCEITIENCCNMNICETPCFEPKLRTAVPGSNGTKKEEKNSLLDNMEENSW